MATMKENKVKGIAGDEVVKYGDKVPIQTHPPTLFILKLVHPVLSKKRKTVSNKKYKVDL